MKTSKNMTLSRALFSLIFLIVALSWSVLWGTGNSQIPLIASAIFAAIVGVISGYKVHEIEEGIIKNVCLSVQTILILLVVGCLISLWMLAGVVPTMIYYGFKILSPSYFLVTTLLLCGIVSAFIGSSWTTMSTVGIALFGISIGLGVPSAMTVGAIVSGSYFGDKMSPLSDTTNVAPLVAGSELFEHIKHMFYTTSVACVLSIAIFFILGIKYSGGTMNPETIEVISNSLKSHFNLSPLLLICPIIVVFLAAKKVPAIITLVIGSLLGVLFAMAVQGADLKTVVETAHFGYVSETGIKIVDNLLSRGGLDSMLFNIALVICAMTLGGVYESTDVLKVVAINILSFVKSVGSLVLATVCSSIFTNIATGDQYLAIIIPGRLFRDMFTKMRLKPKNLSRCLEDAGTLTSPLVPWNVCGIFVTGLFNVPTLSYLPFAFLNWINPIVSVLFGYTGFTMEKYADDEEVPSHAFNL